VAALLAAAGLAYYVVLLVTGWFSDTVWVLAPDRPGLHPPAGWLLPDDRDLGVPDRVKYAAWLAAAAVAAVAAVRTARTPPPAPTSDRPAGRAAAASRRSR
jgi:hypothetical protein